MSGYAPVRDAVAARFQTIDGEPRLEPDTALGRGRGQGAQVPGISNLGAVGQKVDQPQLRVQGGLDPKAIAGSQSLMDNALDTPPAGRGLQLMLLCNRPGDIDPAAPAIAIVNARPLAQFRGQLGK